MPVTNATQIMIDGPRNTVTKTNGDALQNDAFTNIVIVDPATLTKMLPGLAGGGPGPQLMRIDRIEYAIADGLALQLFWDATSPMSIVELAGRGKIEAKHFGGLINNAGAGVNGRITMTPKAIDTTAATAQPVTWTLILYCVKYLFNGVQGA